MSKAIDCVSGQVGADVSRALAPGGEMVVFGALSTHPQTDPDKLIIPIFARSLIYETKTVRGFRLFRDSVPGSGGLRIWRGSRGVISESC